MAAEQLRAFPTHGCRQKVTVTPYFAVGKVTVRLEPRTLVGLDDAEDAEQLERAVFPAAAARALEVRLHVRVLARSLGERLEVAAEQVVALVQVVALFAERGYVHRAHAAHVLTHTLHHRHFLPELHHRVDHVEPRVVRNDRVKVAAQVQHVCTARRARLQRFVDLLQRLVTL